MRLCRVVACTHALSPACVLRAVLCKAFRYCVLVARFVMRHSVRFHFIYLFRFSSIAVPTYSPVGHVVEERVADMGFRLKQEVHSPQPPPYPAIYNSPPASDNEFANSPPRTPEQYSPVQPNSTAALLCILRTKEHPR